MSHHIYHTHAFVLGSVPRAEASAVVSLFTESHGCVRASVQGVRLAQSKLKHALQDFYTAKVDLVRGRRVWRVTGAMHDSVGQKIMKVAHARTAYVRALRFVNRMAPEEEPHPEIFSLLSDAARFLSRETLSEKEARRWEVVVAAHILKRLGYWGGSTSPAVTAPPRWTREHLAHIPPSDYRRAVRHIAEAVAQSHL